MSLFTTAIPNARPDINRRQTMIKWPELVAMALCAAIFLPGTAPAAPHLDDALEATVADSIVAIREGKISVKLSPSGRRMPRPEIPRRITASASSIRVTAVRACRRVRNCPIGTTRLPRTGVMSRVAPLGCFPYIARQDRRLRDLPCRTSFSSCIFSSRSR